MLVGMRCDAVPNTKENTKNSRSEEVRREMKGAGRRVVMATLYILRQIPGYLFGAAASF